MFNPTRDQARRFFIDAWHKRRTGVLLTDMEHAAADLVAMHPEYHALLQDEQSALARDYPAEAGEHNPFLHLSLHLAIAEQLSIDQPPGLRAAFDTLLARSGDRHAAAHVILECLGETVWRAQRDGAPPDGEAYLECVRRRMG
jgi:hypothetical protein